VDEYLRTVFDKFELRVRSGYYYTEEGMWASLEGVRVRVGVTDYLQRTGGDVAFVELPRQGTVVERQGEIGIMETAKTTVSLLSPVSGTVEESNATLSEKPELINSDPYGDGWLVVLSPTDIESDLKSLMSANGYFELMLKKLESEHHRPESG